MKNKKILTNGLMSISAIALFLGAAITVNAGTIYGKTGPEAYAGKVTKSAVYKMISDFDNVTVGRVNVTFNNRGSLRKGVCVEDNTRTIVVELMDEDGIGGGGDDLLKKYTWSFNGLQMTSVTIAGYNENQLVDAKNDNTAELYLRQTLDYRKGDKQTTNGPMYTFDLTVF